MCDDDCHWAHALDDALAAMAAAWPADDTAVLTFATGPACRYHAWGMLLRHLVARTHEHDPDMVALMELLSRPAMVAVHGRHGLEEVVHHAAQHGNMRPLAAGLRIARHAGTSDVYLRRTMTSCCCHGGGWSQREESITWLLAAADDPQVWDWPDAARCFESIVREDNVRAAMQLFHGMLGVRAAALTLAVRWGAHATIAALLAAGAPPLPQMVVAAVAAGDGTSVRLLSEATAGAHTDADAMCATNAYWGVALGWRFRDADIDDTWAALSSSSYMWPAVFAVCMAWCRGEVALVRALLKTWQPPLDRPQDRHAPTTLSNLVADDFQDVRGAAVCAADVEWWRPWGGGLAFCVGNWPDYMPTSPGAEPHTAFDAPVVEPLPALTLVGRMGRTVHGEVPPLRLQPHDAIVTSISGAAVTTLHTARERILLAREVSWARRFWALALWKTVHDARTQLTKTNLQGLTNRRA